MKPEDASTYSLTVPPREDWIDLVTAFVGKAAQAWGYAPKEQRYYELGAEEIFGGLLQENEKGGAITILLRDAPLGMELLFRDKGIPVDTQALPEYSPKNAENIENGENYGIPEDVPGLRIFLARSFMDELAFENRGIQGREVRIIRYRTSRKESDFLLQASQVSQEASEPSGVARLSPESWEIRPMCPEEALGVSRCAWAAYGYSYCEHIYYPERVAELNARGAVRSFVAVTGEGKIFGHAWLSFLPADPKIAEMGGAFVDPRYRGLGCLGGFARELQEEARRRDLEGVFVESVTAHIYSQKPVHKDGFRDCLILLGKVSRTRFREIDEEERQRLTFLVSFRFFHAPSPRRFALPPKHREMLRKIYAHLEIPLEELELPGNVPGSSLFQGKTEFQVGTDGQHRNADIWLRSYGEDAEEELRRIFRGLCYEGIASIYLYLPLEEEATSYFYAKAEERGFFFAGVMPGSSGKDWLVLQFLHDVLLEYHAIQCEDPFGQELLTYVRSRDPEGDLRQKI